MPSKRNKIVFPRERSMVLNATENVTETMNRYVTSVKVELSALAHEPSRL